jgi:hypothetical protein
LAALCALAVACSRDQARIPDELIGRWQTDDPAYAGRMLSISPRSLLFASSATQSENFAVRGVELHDDPSSTLSASIAYGTREQDLTLRVRLHGTEPEVLTLGDRPERWTRLPATGRLP